MFEHTNRRKALGALGGMALGATHFPWLTSLPSVSAGESRLEPQLVKLDAGIAPLVELIEKTPQDDLIEVISGRVTAGVSYRELLAALLLAGVRNVQPRPSVGFKFHSVLVVNSAHLASLASRDQDRWLPIFWALDYFKRTQLEEEQKSGWKLQAVDESQVPRASKAKHAFVEAMEKWDSEAADVAVAGLARSAGAGELFELFCRLGARDYRSIGHKAIYVANSFRTLQCIGWHHAEPVLRSLAFALQNHSGEGNPAENDFAADQPWRENLNQLGDIPDNWLDGTPSTEQSQEMIVAFRQGSASEMPRHAIELLQQGVAPQSIWDAIFLASGELLMQQPGIVGLHALTTANALHYAFQHSGVDETRRLLLLQACAFAPLFRSSASDRGKLKDLTIESVLLESERQRPTEGLEAIFASVSGDRQQAAELLFEYLQRGGNATDVLDEARRLIFLKGRDAHDYKFSSAVLEDYYHVTPPMRDQFLALSVFNLRGTGDRDNGLVERIRNALTA